MAVETSSASELPQRFASVMKRSKSMIFSQKPEKPASSPLSPKKRITQQRLRALLFRLLFIRNADGQLVPKRNLSTKSSPQRNASTKSVPKTTSKTSTAPSTSSIPEILPHFIPEINFSKPFKRPNLSHRHSTVPDFDDTKSTSYRSDISSETSGSRTLRNSTTSHDSGFFEALEIPAAKLLAKFTGETRSRKSSLSRSTSSSTIYYTPAAQTITPTQHEALLRCLRSLRKVLYAQDALTMRLSSNLAHLLAVKERQICCLRSVPDDAKERTIIALTRLRYLVGKAMVRKVVLGKRGATVFSSLESHLNGPSSPIDDAPLEMRMGPIGRKTAPKPKALQWDLKQIEESFIVLRDDLEMQRALDEALREGILGPVRNFRYYRMAVQEQVQMRQFGQFMEEELARFQVLYARWDKGLTIVDRVLGGNHD